MAARLASGQSPAVFPEGALLKPAPEFSHWTASYSYPQDAAKDGGAHLDPDLPRSITITKTRQILHEETVTVSGKKLDCWQQSEEFYRWIPERNVWAAYEKPTQDQIDKGSAVFVAIPKSGFRNLDWIGVKTYVGSLKSKDLTYFVFVPDAANFNLSDAKALQAQPTIAYVDGDSRLPIKVVEHGVACSYKFDKIPEVMQKMPDDLLVEIKQGDEIRTKFNAAPSKEY